MGSATWDGASGSPGKPSSPPVSGGGLSRRSAAGAHAGRDVQQFMTFNNRSSVTTQTDAPKQERWQTIKWVWRNKGTILACLCLVAAMGWQLKEQAQEIENLKSASAHLRAVHKQQLDETRSEESDKAQAALEEAQRLHSLEIQKCQQQRDREKQEELDDQRARRQQVMDHRNRHRHGEVDEAAAHAEKEALQHQEDLKLLKEHREGQAAKTASGGHLKRSPAEADQHHQRQREQREERRKQEEQDQVQARSAATRARAEQERETEEKILQQRADLEMAAREAEEQEKKDRMASVPSFKQLIRNQPSQATPKPQAPAQELAATAASADPVHTQAAQAVDGVSGDDGGGQDAGAVEQQESGQPEAMQVKSALAVGNQEAAPVSGAGEQPLAENASSPQEAAPSAEEAGVWEHAAAAGEGTAVDAGAAEEQGASGGAGDVEGAGAGAAGAGVSAHTESMRARP